MQATPDLTLAYGIRWEHRLLPRRPDGLGVNRFDPADGYVYIGGISGTPQDTGASTEGQFLPRLGATYRLSEKTVLRGGYALGADNTSFINFRNSYPSVFAWAMPNGRFPNADNPYSAIGPTFQQGLIRARRRCRHLDRPHPAASEQPSTTDSYTKDVLRTTNTVHSFNVAVQREFTPWLTGPGRVHGRPREWTDELRERQRRRARHRQCRPAAACLPERPTSTPTSTSVLRRTATRSATGLQTNFMTHAHNAIREMWPTRRRRPRTTRTTLAGALPGAGGPTHTKPCPRRS